MNGQYDKDFDFSDEQAVDVVVSKLIVKDMIAYIKQLEGELTQTRDQLQGALLVQADALKAATVWRMRYEHAQKCLDEFESFDSYKHLDHSDAEEPL